jgi:hypothetical protein
VGYSTTVLLADQGQDSVENYGRLWESSVESAAIHPTGDRALEGSFVVF